MSPTTTTRILHSILYFISFLFLQSFLPHHEMIVNGYSFSARSTYNGRIGFRRAMKCGMNHHLLKESIGKREELSHLSASPLHFHTHHLPLRLWSKSDDNSNDMSSCPSSSNIDDNNMQWGLEQDWELEDLVPKYTIESSKGSIYTTFWTQLRQSSSPVLSSCSEEDLEIKYRSLLDDALIKRKYRPLRPCGPSPERLTDWYIFTSSCRKKSISMMSGYSSNGTKMSFQIQSLMLGNNERNGN